jgi:hypothetical protein
MWLKGKGKSLTQITNLMNNEVPGKVAEKECSYKDHKNYMYMDCRSFKGHQSIRLLKHLKRLRNY